MITEDFISFETAKLLKEKGFDEITFTWYTGKGKFCVAKNNFDDYHANHLSNMATARDKNKCSAPTLQMAMKWLREVHNIHVVPKFDFYAGDYTGRIYDGRRESTAEKDDYIAIVGNSTYEQACEAAIKYCLEKLI